MTTGVVAVVPSSTALSTRLRFRRRRRQQKQPQQRKGTMNDRLPVSSSGRYVRRCTSPGHRQTGNKHGGGLVVSQPGRGAAAEGVCDADWPRTRGPARQTSRPSGLRTTRCRRRCLPVPPLPLRLFSAAGEPAGCREGPCTVADRARW